MRVGEGKSSLLWSWLHKLSFPCSRRRRIWLGLSTKFRVPCSCVFTSNVFCKKNRTKAIYNIKIKLKLGDLRPSPCTRLLFTILPAPYTSATLYDLLREWVAGLNKLAMEGITVTWLVPTNPDVLKLSCFFSKCRVSLSWKLWRFLSQVLWKGKVFKFRFIITSIKGDWPFLRSACGLANGYNCKDKCHRCIIPDLWHISYV